jgi:hypothetical protein
MYEVALVVNGNTVGRKPLEIIMDPAVELAGVQRVAYDNMVTDLHEIQRRGTATAGTLDVLYAEVEAATAKLDSVSGMPSNVRSDFDAFRRRLDAVRVKFGVPLPAAGGGGRGGRGGGGGDPANVLARTGALKGSVLSFWEAPSATLTAQYYEVKPAMEAAIAEANDVLAGVRPLSEALRSHGITLTVPATNQ